MCPSVRLDQRLIMRRMVDLPQPDGLHEHDQFAGRDVTAQPATATVPSGYCLRTDSNE
jgi:hypothetical protein